MTYYEELGIPPDASVNEIRQSYKALARLLHPDRQANPRLKALAECQMKRLSEVIGILSNPQRRRQYDAELANAERQARADWAPPITAPEWQPLNQPWWIRWTVRYGFWALLGIVELTIGTWYFAMANSDRVDKISAAAPTAAAPPTTAAPAQRKAKSVRKKPRSTGRKRRLPDLAPKSDAEAPQGTGGAEAKETSMAASVAKPQTTKALPAAEQKPAHAVEDTDQSPFVGNWLYAPPEEETAMSGQYPATYVELVLQEEKSALSGHYRSRHRIPDKAISPEVLLQVQGTPGADNQATLSWTSADGANGKAELTLRAPNLLHVMWWTTESGRHDALSSGTAVLIRQMTQ